MACLCTHDFIIVSISLYNKCRKHACCPLWFKSATNRFGYFQAQKRELNQQELEWDCRVNSYTLQQKRFQPITDGTQFISPYSLLDLKALYYGIFTILHVSTTSYCLDLQYVVSDKAEQQPRVLRQPYYRSFHPNMISRCHHITAYCRSLSVLLPELATFMHSVWKICKYIDVELLKYSANKRFCPEKIKQGHDDVIIYYSTDNV